MVDRREYVGRESFFFFVRCGWGDGSDGVYVTTMQALSEFLCSITSLPSDTTLLSLPPGPPLFMYRVTEAADRGVALSREHTLHQTGPADDVYDFDAEITAERGGDDGCIEHFACFVADGAVDGRPTGCHGICE